MSAWLQSLRRLCRRVSLASVWDPQKTQLIDCRAFALEVAPPREESRASERRPCNREVAFQREGARSVGLSFMGRARNVSAKGMGLIAGCRFDAGTVLLIEMPQVAGPSAGRLIPAVVVHARPLPRRGWYLGCAFAQPLPEQDIRRLS